MSANLEWDIPFTLTTPFSADPLLLNTTGAGPRYLFDRTTAVMGPGISSSTDLRRTRDFIPQASGEIKHIGFKPGYEMTIPLMLWVGSSDAEDDVDARPACEGDLVSMGDLLMGHVETLVQGEGRISWQPSTVGTTTPDQRMLDQISLLTWPAFSIDDATGLVTLTFEVFTAFPYALNLTEGTPDTVPNTLTNVGTSRVYPVFRVHGATNAFILTNNSVLDANGNPLQIIYDSGLPGGAPIGGGDYAEINTFKNTVYLNGDGANLKANIDVLDSEFFWLAPGANDIAVTWTDGTGSGVDAIWNSAWA